MKVVPPRRRVKCKGECVLLLLNDKSFQTNCEAISDFAGDAAYAVVVAVVVVSRSCMGSGSLPL